MQKICHLINNNNVYVYSVQYACWLLANTSIWGGFIATHPTNLAGLLASIYVSGLLKISTYPTDSTSCRIWNRFVSPYRSYEWPYALSCVNINPSPVFNCGRFGPLCNLVVAAHSLATGIHRTQQSLHGPLTFSGRLHSIPGLDNYCAINSVCGRTVLLY